MRTPVDCGPGAAPWGCSIIPRPLQSFSWHEHQSRLHPLLSASASAQSISNNCLCDGSMRVWCLHMMLRQCSTQDTQNAPLTAYLSADLSIKPLSVTFDTLVVSLSLPSLPPQQQQQQLSPQGRVRRSDQQRCVCKRGWRRSGPFPASSHSQICGHDGTCCLEKTGVAGATVSIPDILRGIAVCLRLQPSRMLILLLPLSAAVHF